MWGRARTSLNVFGGTIWAIPKPPVMACRGLWSTVKAFLVAEAAKRERYYKSGLGRDELECLGLWCGRRGDRSRVQIPPARFFSNQDILGPRLRFLRRKSATADSSCGERDARATLRHAQRWNCRAAECRKIDAFQCGHAHAQGAGRKLSVLHDRSKRGCGNRP